MQSKEILSGWQRKVHILHRCNALLAAKYDISGKVLGLSSTILSVIVTTSIFTALTQSENTIVIIVTGILSMITAIFSAAYQYLKLPDLTSRYHQAVSSYGNLRREIEITLSETEGNKISEDVLKHISKEWTDLDKKAPPIPNKLYQKVEEKIKNEELSNSKKKN